MSAKASAQKGKAAKKKKDDDPYGAMDKSEKKFVDLLREGELNKASVADLKEFLTVKGMPNKGNKNFLVQMVEEYFETNYGIS